ncbi:MAG: hypothetical protein LBK47_10535 [Prevotellaceae bacterium]|jgi:hypothetical protein|nr:hypothetical protein [Prevotellaceae bacterium]
MKKSLLVVAVLVASAVALSSCSKKKDSPKTWSCTCTADLAPASGLDEAGKNTYTQECRAKTITASLAKGAGVESCE